MQLGLNRIGNLKKNMFSLVGKNMADDKMAVCNISYS